MVEEEAIGSENKVTQSNLIASHKSWSRVVGTIPSIEGIDMSKPLESYECELLWMTSKTR